MGDEDAQTAGEITRHLIAWREGSPGAMERLVPLVYQELRRMARGQLRRLSAGNTLDTTALLHEAYLKLVRGGPRTYRDRGHFFAVAARAMRQLLVDEARRRLTAKRDAGEEPVPAQDAAGPAPRLDQVLAVDEVLGRLQSVDPRLVHLVELRFFAGLSVEETAEAMELSPRTVKRDWRKARAFLYEELAGSADR